MDITVEMALCLPEGPPDKLGIAISGGGDSTALLYLLVAWARAQGVRLFAATVDHGLREGSAAEAASVAKLCAGLGIQHQTLRWSGWNGSGNLQDQARRARQHLLTHWAMQHELPVVALGHTMDDQAETLLMRLARGSGVDGLAAIQASHKRGGIRWIRPLLDTSREDLRVVLRALDATWLEDPSNQDERFDRVRIRKAMTALELSPNGLAETAARMQTARVFLEQETQKAARKLATVTVAGDVEINRDGLFELADELRFRLLAHSLRFVASAPYRPRLAALHNLMKLIENEGKATLAGCLVATAKPGLVRLSREYAAVRDMACSTEAIWDRRWRVAGAAPEAGFQIRALGAEGLKNCPDWRDCDLPRDSLIAGPAVWSGQELIAAPLAGIPNGCVCVLQKGAEAYFSSILSH